MLVDDYVAKLRQDQIFFGPEDKVGSIRWYIKWYRDKAPAKRIWFRAFGLVTLVTSISLPFVIAFVPEASKALVASFLAWIIALAGGINGFFQFNKSWQNYIETHFKLEKLLMEWELSISALLGKSDDESLIKAQELTAALVTGARAAITDETKSYFEEVKFPNLNIETK